MQVPPKRWTDVYETSPQSASPKIGFGEKVRTNPVDWDEAAGAASKPINFRLLTTCP